MNHELRTMNYQPVTNKRSVPLVMQNHPNHNPPITNHHPVCHANLFAAQTQNPKLITQNYSDPLVYKSYILYILYKHRSNLLAGDLIQNPQSKIKNGITPPK